MKAIFLDIDGPMIPDTMFVFERNASYGHKFSPVCVNVLNAVLAQDLDARIVCNTTHNLVHIQLRENLIKAGIPENAFAHDYLTKYPQLTGRLTAISEWMHRHPDYEQWIAFDDCEIADERAYLVDPQYGIGLGAFNHAAEIFGFKGKFVL